jgi:hypothetical protein
MKRPYHFRLAAAVALGACSLSSLPAPANVQMSLTVTDISCSVTTSSGTSAVPCDGASFATVLLPGGSARIDANVNYTYHDDGLAVDLPYPPFQNDASGLSWTQVDHEAGAIYIDSSHCQDRYCSLPYETSGTPFAPFFLGRNDHPDDLAGSWAVFASASFPSDSVGGAFARLSIGAFGLFVSGEGGGRPGLVQVTAVPEPGQQALLLVGLALLAMLGSFRRAAWASHGHNAVRAQASRAAA